MVDSPKQDREAGLPRTKIGSRYLTKYDPEIALAMVERIAEGETLDQIVKTEGFPARGTFMKWMVRTPELRQAYMAARELSALSMEEEALTGARVLAMAPGTSQKVRANEILIGQLRWSAARRDPKTYGDKGIASLVVPVTINTSLNLGEGQKAVESEIPDIYTLELKANPEDPMKPLLPPPKKTRKRVLVPPNIPLESDRD